MHFYFILFFFYFFCAIALYDCVYLHVFCAVWMLESSGLPARLLSRAKGGFNDWLLNSSNTVEQRKRELASVKAKLAKHAECLTKKVKIPTLQHLEGRKLLHQVLPFVCGRKTKSSLNIQSAKNTIQGFGCISGPLPPF